MDILTTVLLGVGTVFVGLICLVLIIELTHRIITLFSRGKAKQPASPAADAPVSEPDIDHGTLVAVVSAAVAEQLGTDVSAIRIRSIKRI